jgi:modulator of FtsH protease
MHFPAIAAFTSHALGQSGMTHAFEAKEWSELYVMLGGAVAVLAGLLFVALSAQIAGVREARQWRARGFDNTFALVGLLIEAAFVLVPQDRMPLGGEILACNLVMLFLVPVRALARLLRLGADIPWWRFVSGMAAWLLGAAGGASLIAGAGGGLYLVTASCLWGICLCILNAWSLLAVHAKDG